MINSTLCYITRGDEVLMLHRVKKKNDVNQDKWIGIGGKFEELRAIIDGVGKDNIGVCLDTCHMYDAGYDIVNDLDGVLVEFDRVVGLSRLKALHLNDSKNPFASHKDRHECIGKGSLGLETFRNIVNHPQLRDKPMILETPNLLPDYAGEISLLRQMA